MDDTHQYLGAPPVPRARGGVDLLVALVSLVLAALLLLALAAFALPPFAFGLPVLFVALFAAFFVRMSDERTAREGHSQCQKHPAREGHRFLLFAGSVRHHTPQSASDAWLESAPRSDLAEHKLSEFECRPPCIPVRGTAGADCLDKWPVARCDRADECAVLPSVAARCPHVPKSVELDHFTHRMRPKARTKMAKKTLTKIEIKAQPSQYSDGAWSRVVVRLGWCFRGTAVSIIEERSVQAVGHRLVADALERTPPTERWSFATALHTSYRDVVEITVTLELGFGTAGETARAKTFLTELTKRIK
jgi:hypothetical protein